MCELISLLFQTSFTRPLLPYFICTLLAPDALTASAFVTVVGVFYKLKRGSVWQNNSQGGTPLFSTIQSEGKRVRPAGTLYSYLDLMSHRQMQSVGC